jgi:RNA polymerase sigma-70 factor (ECF subfamily)
MDGPLDAPDRRASDGPSDVDVIARVLAGDTQAFSRLVARYQRTLYRHAVALVLDHDTAGDMVQDAFVRAYTSLRDCRDRTRFRAWLFQTLRNRCLDHLKEARRRSLPLDAAASVEDPADGPMRLVERRALRTEIERALARLPAAQREAFVMHYVDGMSYEAMADLLGTSVSAVKMRALRAREMLSALLRRDDVTGSAPASSLLQMP